MEGILAAFLLKPAEQQNRSLALGWPPKRTRCPSRLLGLLPLVFLCAACGGLATSPRSHEPISSPAHTPATQTAQAQQNSPVTVHLRVLLQQGTLVQQDSKVTVQIAVTNHTSKPIWLFGICGQPAIVVS